jgi:hypothetical protein
MDSKTISKILRRNRTVDAISQTEGRGPWYIYLTMLSAGQTTVF